MLRTFQSTFFNWKFSVYTVFLVIDEQKLILYFFLTAITSEHSKYLKEQLGVFFKFETTKIKLAENI